MALNEAMSTSTSYHKEAVKDRLLLLRREPDDCQESRAKEDRNNSLTGAEMVDPCQKLSHTFKSPPCAASLSDASTCILDETSARSVTRCNGRLS